MLAILVEGCYWTINISLIGSLVAIAILLYRKITRYSPVVNNILWFVLALRLLIPASYITPFSIVRFYTLLGSTVTTTQGKIPFYFSNIISQAIEYHPLTFKSTLILTIFEILSIIWILGIVFILGLFLYSYLKSHDLKKKESYVGKIHDMDIYESSLVESPFLFGLFRPVVFLPLKLDVEDREHVIYHEKAHRAHHDNLKRLFALLVCSIHWFNPVVWICFRVFTDDLEIEADRLAVKWVGIEHRKKYLESLVRLQPKMNLIGSNFTSHSLVRRIETQLKRKTSLAYTIWFAFFAVILSYFVLLANL
jgi:beta-lactamase regulating signal transducer with metallopeptidase domain